MRDTYAERYDRHEHFEITAGMIQFLAVIFDACARTIPVRVKVFDEATENSLAGRIIEGVARHVVELDSHNFAPKWRHDTRLRISGNAEFFIPLGDIEAIQIVEERR